jgi:hypothetical protein
MSEHQQQQSEEDNSDEMKETLQQQIDRLVFRNEIHRQLPNMPFERIRVHKYFKVYFEWSTEP